MAKSDLRVRVADETSAAFGGVGFHVFSHLHAGTTPELEAVLFRRWAELNPSFARLTHKWGWDLERVLPYLERLKATGTEVYLTTWNPRDVATDQEMKAYASDVVGMLEDLVRSRGFDNIKTYCMTNELSLNGWGKLREDLPKFKAYHAAIAAALRARDLPVGLLATDASPIKRWDTLEWAASNMDEMTAAYGGHHYINDFEPGDPGFYPWFLERATWGVGLARARGKPFIVGEFGARQHRGERYGYAKWDGCAHWDTPAEPLVGIQLAEATAAMINAGVYGLGYWTYADFPDNPRKRYANKWGVLRRSGGGISIRPHYYAYGLLTRFFRGPAKTVSVVCDDPLLRAAAVRQGGGESWSVLVVNARAERTAFTLTVESAGPDERVRKYLYDPAHVPDHVDGALPPPEWAREFGGAALDDDLPARSMAVYTTAFRAGAPTCG